MTIKKPKKCQLELWKPKRLNDASTFTHAHAQPKKKQNLLNQPAFNNAKHSHDWLLKCFLQATPAADVVYKLLCLQHPLSLSLKHYHSSTLTLLSLHFSVLLTLWTSEPIISLYFHTTLYIPLLPHNYCYLLWDLLRVNNSNLHQWCASYLLFFLLTPIFVHKCDWTLALIIMHICFLHWYIYVLTYNTKLPLTLHSYRSTRRRRTSTEGGAHLFQTLRLRRTVTVFSGPLSRSL